MNIFESQSPNLEGYSHFCRLWYLQNRTRLIEVSGLVTPGHELGREVRDENNLKKINIFFHIFISFWFNSGRS